MFKNKNERMPMWLAVGISVVVGLPLGLWLGGFSLALWLVFTVWAVYLALGGNIAAGKKVMHAYLGGAISAALVQMFNLVLCGWMDSPKLWRFTSIPLLPGGINVNFPILPVVIAYFIGFCVVVWWMKFSKNWQMSSLAYFSGISLTLACIFTQQGPAWVGHSSNQYLLVIGALIVSILSALGGCVIAFISVWLNGAKQPPAEVEEAKA